MFNKYPDGMLIKADPDWELECRKNKIGRIEKMKYEISIKTQKELLKIDADSSYEKGSYTCFAREDYILKVPTENIILIHVKSDELKLGEHSLYFKGSLFILNESSSRHGYQKLIAYDLEYISAQGFNFMEAKSIVESLAKMDNVKNIVIKSSPYSTKYMIIFDAVVYL